MTQLASAVKSQPPAPPQRLSFGATVTVRSRDYFNGMRGVVRNSFTAGGILSYYVMLADGITAFDADELEAVTC